MRNEHDSGFLDSVRQILPYVSATLTNSRFSKKLLEARAPDFTFEVCYLGIDTPTREELIVNRHGSIDEVRDFIGADNLRYLTLESLREATGDRPFCFGCMTGDYPV